MTLHGEQFTPSAMNVIQQAMQFAGEMRHHAVGSEHLLYSLADPQCEPTGDILTASGLDAGLIRAMIEQYDGFGTASEPPQGITAETGRLLEQAAQMANQMGSEQAAPEHILAALMRDSRCVAYRIVSRSGADPERIIRELTDCMKEDKPGMPKNAKDKTKTLDQFSRDLTAMAKDGKLDPVIGRDKEIQRVIQILSRRSKNNPVLIGEPGVGKTAIAEGLAQRVVAGNVPDTLQNKRVVSLDLARMVSGAKYRGDFEERIKNTLDEIMAAGDVVLFIDELHTLIGAGAGEGSMDAANIIKPPLSRGELQVIGATTLNEYRQNIEKDAALERRFQTVLVDEPSPEDTVEILKGLRPRYEEHHKLHISDEAIEAAVKLSVRYISDRYLPDKAIDLIDEAASRVRTSGDTAPTDLKALESRLAALNTEKEDAVKYQDYERAAMLRDMQKQVREELEAARTNWMKDGSGGVGQQDVAQVVAAWTGVPVTMLTEDESARLLKMEEILHQRVIGQDEAVRAVSRAIRRGRVGLKDPKRPTGSFLFLGPTGVGKTELCKALAEAMFGDETAMLRVDMSEYMERHTVSKLIGSPPGYVGYDEGGQLTEKVRRKPYSVILFDEIEKAHPDVFNIMLQIMEDGILTDSQGRRVDFRNTVIVMTSNVGAKNITDRRSALGFGGKDADGEQTVSVEKIREAVMGDLRNTFRPEFLNRIDDIIVFHQLDQQNIQAIARLMLAQVAGRMQQLGITFEADDSAVELIAKKGFDPVYGARPLRREIQSSIEDAAAEKMLESAVGEGGSIQVTADGDELVLHVTAAKEAVAVA